MALIGTYATDALCHLEDIVQNIAHITCMPPRCPLFLDMDESQNLVPPKLKSDGTIDRITKAGSMRCTITRGVVRKPKVRRVMKVNFDFDDAGLITACNCRVDDYSPDPRQGEGTHHEEVAPTIDVLSLVHLQECVIVGVAPPLRIITVLMGMQSIFKTSRYALEISHVMPGHDRPRGYCMVQHAFDGETDPEKAARFRLNAQDQLCLLNERGEIVHTLDIPDPVEQEGDATEGTWFYDDPWHPARVDPSDADRFGKPALGIAMTTAVGMIMAAAGPLHFDRIITTPRRQQPTPSSQAAAADRSSSQSQALKKGRRPFDPSKVLGG